MKTLINLAERGFLPDWLISYGVRRLSVERLNSFKDRSLEECCTIKRELIRRLCDSPIAVETDKANEQHYELPPDYFQLVLGKHLKYSGCYWPQGVQTLDEAEEASLKLTCERAQIHDGMEILELGCGWGSLSLWMAERFPHSRILSVSNSNSQREFIESRCRERNLTNLSVRTENIVAFQTDKQFDRVVSVEMFEHLRNYKKLFARIAGWLNKDGKLFTHIFSHKHFAYLFETDGSKNWMGQYFFTGGIMPSDDLFHYFQERLILEDHWQLSGTHYEKTAREWLRNHDKNRDAILSIFSDVYDSEQKEIWFNRWRLFYIACAELFGYKNGREWGISHYLFEKRAGY